MAGCSSVLSVNTKPLTESLAEGNSELGSVVPKGDCAGNFVVGG